MPQQKGEKLLPIISDKAHKLEFNFTESDKEAIHRLPVSRDRPQVLMVRLTSLTLKYLWCNSTGSWGHLLNKTRYLSFTSPKIWPTTTENYTGKLGEKWNKNCRNTSVLTMSNFSKESWAIVSYPHMTLCWLRWACIKVNNAAGLDLFYIMNNVLDNCENLSDFITFANQECTALHGFAR